MSRFRDLSQRASAVFRIGSQMVARLERLEELDRITPSELQMTLDVEGVRYAISARVVSRPGKA